jgi:NADH-quinone oxidoreductase subunit G
VKSQLVRIADVPIYRSDAIVRRADALQETADSAAPRARMNPADLTRLGLASGGRAKIGQPGKGSAVIDLLADATVSTGVVCLSAAHELTADLGEMIAAIDVEAA